MNKIALTLLVGAAVAVGAGVGVGVTWSLVGASSKASNSLAVGLSAQNMDLAISNGTPSAAREALLEHLKLLQEHAGVGDARYQLSMTRTFALLGALAKETGSQHESDREFEAAGKHCKQAGLKKCSSLELRAWAEKYLNKVRSSD